MKPVALRLPDEAPRRLQRLAESTGRSKISYMIEAIKGHLDALEDLYLAEKRLAAIRSGESPVDPLEDTMKRYGMEG